MKIGPLDLDRRVLIVAEIGNNHEGDAARAARMIRLAAEAGADAVKLQTFRAEDYVSPADPERLARLKRFELSPEAFRELAREAGRVGVPFFSTPFDLASLDLVAEISCAIKIASGDLVFYPLIEKAARTGKPMILSTGLAELPLVRRTVSLVETTWGEMGHRGDLAVLHCVVAYPTPADQANLGAIAALRREFPACTVGYSDHTAGIEAAPLAVALGARIIEKHFTLDKNFSSFRDHQLSADPPEMAELVKAVRRAEALLGDGIKTPRPCEIGNLALVRRSIALNRYLTAGEMLRREHLTWTRPAGGFAPGREAEVLGRRLKRALAKGAQLHAEDLEDGRQA